jgi:tetratricopeptide (TPR) repeat protein
MFIAFTNNRVLKKSFILYPKISRFGFANISCICEDAGYAKKIQHATELEKIPNKDAGISQRLMTLYISIGNDFYRQKEYKDADSWYEKTLPTTLKHINLRYMKRMHRHTHAPVFKYYTDNTIQSPYDDRYRYAFLNREVSFSNTWWAKGFANMRLLEELAYGSDNNISAKLYLGLGYTQQREFKLAQKTYQKAIDIHHSLEAKLLLAELYATQNETDNALTLYDDLLNNSQNSYINKTAARDRNKILAFYNKSSKPSATILQQLKTYDSNEVDKYIANSSLEELQTQTCRQKVLLDHIVNFCTNATNAEGTQIFKIFSTNDRTHAYIEKIKTEFKFGQCLGLSAVFLISSLKNDHQDDSKEQNMNLRWFFRCMILLQLPHESLSIEQKTDITDFISLVIHLQNNKYPAHINNEGKHIPLDVPHNIYNEDNDIQFSHIKNIDLLENFTIAYSQHTTRFEQHSLDLLLQPGPKYVFFFTDTYEVSCYKHRHATCLHKDKNGVCTYYDPSIGVTRVTLENSKDLDIFKQKHLAQFVNSYQIRTHPLRDKPALKGEINIRAGIIAPKINKLNIHKHGKSNSLT